jgi:hypothetical protein
MLSSKQKVGGLTPESSKAVKLYDPAVTPNDCA